MSIEEQVPQISEAELYEKFVNSTLPLKTATVDQKMSGDLDAPLGYFDVELDLTVIFQRVAAKCGFGTVEKYQERREVILEARRQVENGITIGKLAEILHLDLPEMVKEWKAENGMNNKNTP